MHLLIRLGLLASVLAPSLGGIAAQTAPAPAAVPKTETVAVAPGVVYRHLARTTAAGEPLSIHVLEVSRGRKDLGLRAVSACAPTRQCEMRRELPTRMAAEASAAGASVLAVVNGDYDQGGMGISVGAAITAGRLWTTRRDAEPGLAILRSGEPVIGAVATAIELRKGRARWPIGTLNKPLGAASEPVLYTREFRAAVKTGEKLRALVVGNLAPGLPLRADSKVSGAVIEKLEDVDEVRIPEGALVLVQKVAGAPDTASAFQHLRAGDRVQFRFSARVAGKKGVRDLVGGFPILVRGGRREIVGAPAPSLAQRHPRTAACYNRRAVLFTVVDGRQPRLSVGMTLTDLADLMVSLGCQVAINTDGGGSSVMAVSLPPNGSSGAPLPPEPAPLQIVNSPSDGKERGRGNAWLVVQTAGR